MNQATKILEALEKYILYIVIAFLPVIVLLNSTSPAVLPKLELIFAGVTLFLVIWVIKTILRSGLKINFGRFDLAVLLIILAYTLSAIFATPNKMEAFFIPGIASFVIASGVLYFLINQSSKAQKFGLTMAFLFSGVLYSLSILLTELGFFSKIPQLPNLIKDPTFNPLGGVIPGIVYLTPLVVLAVGIIVKEKEAVKKIFWGVATAVILMAMVILIGNTLPGKAQSPRLPTFQTSWEVLVGTVAKSPIFGVGPGNYLTAFNVFRPVTYNQTDLWQVRFTTATDYYLTSLTETGLAGLFAFAILIIAAYRFVKADIKFGRSMDSIGLSLERMALPATIALLAAFPASPVLVTPLFILLALNSGSEEHPVNFKTEGATSSGISSRIPGIVIGILVLGGIVYADFLGTKMVLAESTYEKGVVSLGNNDAKGTYNFISAAITENPQVDRYHASLAQLDMALASSIANKKDITDADKTTVTQLVQQAINEGKATVTLNPQRSGNWEILAQIYRSIMPFAQGADQFAIQTYTQAVALDPTNPNLRISLGGVYYALGQYDNAIDSFKLATVAKPDLANGYYNLAITYQAKKDYDNAIAQINIVLTLVKPGTQDYTLAQNLLNDLKKNKAAAPVTGTSNLTPPQTQAVSNIKPPITLPKEATPPAATQ